MGYLFFDVRALALMRICVSLVIILDLSIRITDLEAFYTNTGAVPLHMLFEHAWNNYFISFHAISGKYEVQFILFLIAYLFAFLLLIGYRTRLFTILSWVMMVSLHNRNGLILQGGDDLLRMVLFWSIFLPWGMRYSYDSLKAPAEIPALQMRSPAVFAYLLQICYIYTGSALLKGYEWHTDFSALYYVYSLDQIAFPITSLLYPHPELLRVLTAIAYYFELLVPVLFFVPFLHSFFRTLGVFLIIFFHSMNEITLLVGLFPLIGISTCLGILPSEFMDRLERWTAGVKSRIMLFFLFTGTLINSLIKWKPPVSRLSAFREGVTTALVIFLTVFVFDWNYSNLNIVKSKLSDDLRFIGYVLRLDQAWGMFAPGVLKDDGWYILHARTRDNKEFDMMHPGEKLHFNKPHKIVGMFKNDRWRKYYENLMLSNHWFMRGYYCNYRKRIWNEKHPELPVKSLEVIYMKEMSLPDYQYSKPQKFMLWHCE